MTLIFNFDGSQIRNWFHIQLYKPIENMENSLLFPQFYQSLMELPVSPIVDWEKSEENGSNALCPLL